MEGQRAVVGRSVIKSDALEKVLGRSAFAADLRMPGMLHAKVLRSPLAHALVRNIDVTKARALPGVVAILTHKDIPGANAFGIILKDEPVLVSEKVRQRGDALALVAAESEEAVLKALKLVEVDYQELPAVYSAEEAMLETSPKVHGESNVLTVAKIRKGDAARALESCDIVIANKYTTQMVEHCYIEPEAGIAYMEGDVVVVKVSTQNPHYDRRDVAMNLGIPQNKVRIIQTTTGGGFGGKLDISTQCHLALLAWKTKRPVRLVYSREESFTASPKRHPYVISYISGASRDGRLQAVKVQVIGDTGAYASYGPGVLKRAAVHATGPYEVPTVSVDAYCVYTNNPKCGAMRGFGVPQMAFAHESQMDQLAEKLGMSPFEIRLKNALRVGSRTATGQLLHGSVGIVETLDKAMEKAASVLPLKGGEGS
ncbi:nicotinate dehydrogenase large molybdopterin subunit [Clostridiales bacterium PH28_bin88]|nr:nicotinate dehydrogenase large molybdopterin subunit [Clostridiales bacterium PH28_bin88]